MGVHEKINDYCMGRIDLDCLNSEEINGLIKSNNLEDDYLDDTEDGCLYRGYYFKDDKDFYSFVSHSLCNISINTYSILAVLRENRITSWTSDRIVAMDFSYGSGWSYYNEKETKDLKGIAVILSAYIEKCNVLYSCQNVDPSSECYKNVINDSEYIVDRGNYKCEIYKISEKAAELLKIKAGRLLDSILIS